MPTPHTCQALVCSSSLLLLPATARPYSVFLVITPRSCFSLLLLVLTLLFVTAPPLSCFSSPLLVLTLLLFFFFTVSPYSCSSLLLLLLALDPSRSCLLLLTPVHLAYCSHLLLLLLIHVPQRLLSFSSLLIILSAPTHPPSALSTLST